MDVHQTTYLASLGRGLAQAGLSRGVGTAALLGAAGVAASMGLAGAVMRSSTEPSTVTAPEFMAAVRAAGINRPDTAVLDTGRDVCRRIWSLHTAGDQVAEDLAREDLQMTSDDASHFMLAAYNHLCPTPAGYGYWTPRAD
jgi:hypothetical protein